MTIQVRLKPCLAATVSLKILLPFFVKTVIQHYKHILKSDSNGADKAASQSII